MIQSTPRRSRRRQTLILGLTFGVSSLLVPVATPSVVADNPAAVVTGLMRGAQGDGVRAVQEALIAKGFDIGGPADGFFGAGTEAAVRAFQKKRGLRVTGSVDAATAIGLGLQKSPYLGLKLGDSGRAVRQLQETIKAAGSGLWTVDGTFGSSTETSLKVFQRAYGLTDSGRVDLATAGVLAGLPVPSVTDAPARQPATTTTDGAAASTPPAGSTPSSAPAATTSTTLVGLKIGARGPAVKRLQQLIIASGFPVVGGADGVFGALTASSLRSLQNANGLEVTGVVDQPTARVLRLAEGRTAPDAAPTPANPLVGLQFGAMGADVRALQQALVDRGFTVAGGGEGRRLARRS